MERIITDTILPIKLTTFANRVDQMKSMKSISTLLSVENWLDQSEKTELSKLKRVDDPTLLKEKTWHVVGREESLVWIRLQEKHHDYP